MPPPVTSCPPGSRWLPLTLPVSGYRQSTPWLTTPNAELTVGDNCAFCVAPGRANPASPWFPFEAHAWPRSPPPLRSLFVEFIGGRIRGSASALASGALLPPNSLEKHDILAQTQSLHSSLAFSATLAHYLRLPPSATPQRWVASMILEWMTKMWRGLGRAGSCVAPAIPTTAQRVADQLLLTNSEVIIQHFRFLLPFFAVMSFYHVLMTRASSSASSEGFRYFAGSIIQKDAVWSLRRQLPRVRYSMVTSLQELQIWSVSSLCRVTAISEGFAAAPPRQFHVVMYTGEIFTCWDCLYTHFD